MAYIKYNVGCGDALGTDFGSCFRLPTPTPEPIPTHAGHGYFCAGHISSTYSKKIDRLSFTTETVSLLAAVVRSNTYGLAGVSGAFKGYLGGGAPNTYTAYIDGLDFITEAELRPSTWLKAARSNHTGVSSLLKGYWGGGKDSGASKVIDGIVFSSEAAVVINTTLAAERYNLAGVNSASKGYFGGGVGPDWSNSGTSMIFTKIDGIDFSSESAVNPSAVLSQQKANLCGVSGTVKGYFAGGSLGPSPMTSSSVIHGFVFSSETHSAVSATLSLARQYIDAVNSVTNGYFGGGFNDLTYKSNEIDGINFNTETAINPGATLTEARYYSSGLSYKTNITTPDPTPTPTIPVTAGQGYFGGGHVSYSYSRKIDSLSFTTETVTGLTSTLRAITYSLAGVSGPIKGYFGGGAPSTYVAYIDGLSFLTNIVAPLSTSLTVARTNHTGINSSVKGFWGGGRSSAATKVIDSIIFSTDVTANTNATLSHERYNLAGVNSTSKGYFGGGVGPDWNSGGTSMLFTEIDGIDFSSETSINPSAALSQQKASLCAVSSTSKGYFAGGSLGPSPMTSSSVIHGFVFSNESHSDVGATLSLARQYLDAVNSLSKGYFGGGFNDVSMKSDAIDGIVFLTETAINPGATLTEARYYSAGLSYKQ
jgi:hypothetical protein